MAKETPKKSIARRVIKQGNNFICGICGRVHKFPQTAEDCVERCFQKTMATASVSEDNSPKAGSRKYRCSFCKRIYPTLSKAKECVDACKKKAKEKRNREINLQVKTKASMAERAKKLAQIAQGAAQEYEAGDDSLSSKVAKRGQSYVCLRCHSLYPTIREAKECADRHNIKPKTSYAERVAKATSAAMSKRKNISRKEKEIFDHADKLDPEPVTLPPDRHNVRAPVASSDDGEEMYSREGSKYTCKLCSKSYYTRNEVVNCFKSHKGVPVKKEKKEGIILDSQQSGGKEDFAIERAKRLADAKDKDKFLRDGAKYICKACGKGYFTKMEVIKCFDGHLKPPEEEKTDDTEEVPSSFTLAADAGKPDKEKFKRDGAKYVCKKCSRKYYTKIEVVECFNYDCPETLPSQMDDDI